MVSMFSKTPAGGLPMPPAGGKHTPFSVIGGDVVITGKLTASADLHIDGRIEGDVACAGLVQGQEGVVRGNIVARTARIAGTVEGSINADELILEKSARIVGDIVYGAMSMESGAKVDGCFTPKGALPAGAADQQIKVVTLGD